MTVASEVSRESVIGTDTTPTYSFPFYIVAETHLRVSRSDVVGVLVLGVDYTVTGAGKAGGGTITLTDGDLPDGVVMVMRRVVPITQLTDIRNQGKYFAELHENQFDLMTMQDQAQQDDIDRSIKLAETVDPADFNAEIPGDLVGAASVSLITNADGDGFVVGPTASEIAGANASAIAAAASAVAALASENAASDSEVAALASEVAAAASAAAALASEVAAAASAVSASDFADDAANSQSAAASSESAASVSENNAAASEDAAAASAVAALASEVAAAASAVDSANSALDAMASEVAAAASAAAAALQFIDYNDASTGAIIALNTTTSDRRSIRLTGAAPELQGVASGADGKIVYISNLSSVNIPVRHLAAGASAGNKIDTGNGGLDSTIKPGAFFVFKYDNTSLVWRLIGGGGGSGASAANFTADNPVAGQGLDQVLRYTGTAALTLTALNTSALPVGGRITFLALNGIYPLTIPASILGAANGDKTLGAGGRYTLEKDSTLGLVEVTYNGL